MAVLTKQDLLENEYFTTRRLQEALFILADGTLWNGQYEARNYDALDHMEIELFTKYDHYDGSKFWREVLVTKGLVMVDPDYREMTTHPDYKPTDVQKRYLENAEAAGWTIIEKY